MTQITIRQTGSLADSPNAQVSFDGQAGFPVTVQNPFSEAEEARLAWYFEKWLTFPFTEQVKARAAAASVRTYGEALFSQTLGADAHITIRYRQALSRGADQLLLQVVGEPDFHALHWEALWDPERPRPLTLDAAMIRSGAQPTLHDVQVQLSPTLNLLLVTARPHGIRDVGYRTIQRPLIEMLRQTRLPVQVDLVRPGSWRALVDHLDGVRRDKGPGHYQIIHFDLHGAVLSLRQLRQIKGVSPDTYQVRLRDRYAREDLTELVNDDRPTAWLFFEDDKEGAISDDLDAVSAREVADKLLENAIPIAILNACQSGQETGDPETGLGSRLLAAGVQSVVAMGYSVTVSAAERLMQTLYAQLFAPPHDLLAALSAGRAALHNDKQRRAAYNQTIRLEDWLLPVVYQPSAQTNRQLPLRAMSFEEEAVFNHKLATRYPPPAPEYGFVGRDLDVLQIEKRLLQRSEGKRRNLLLIQGMGGAGKSTLLHHLGHWWQTTGLVGEVFYFGYDERAYRLPQLLDALARRLLNVNIPPGAKVARDFAAFQAMQPEAQVALLARRLRAERHLLILDNLESVTGDPLAIPNTLDVAEQAAIRAFLAELLDGQTLVLLGSRGSAAWLQGGKGAGGGPAPLRDVDIYPLPGLDPGAAADLAERILQRQVSDAHKQDAYKADPAFMRLLHLLDGSPLALEVVLSNLARQAPAQIVAALEAGDVAIDAQRPLTPDEMAARRTQSILACIDYSHANLSPVAQQLLLCLAPFTGVINRNWLDLYSAQLKQQPALAHLPFEHWDEVIDEAINWGLLTPDAQVAGYLRVQPIFPYFLRTRLEETPEVKNLIGRAFQKHYDEIGSALIRTIRSKESNTRQLGIVYTTLEFENLAYALNITLEAQLSPFNIYGCLSNYADATQNHRLILPIGQHVQTQIQQISLDDLSDELLIELGRVNTDIGTRHLMLKQFDEAQDFYQEALALVQRLEHLDSTLQVNFIAVTYHQLGRVAQAQRQWAQAEAHYQQALAITIDFNDRYSQASTYHQLGMVAQEQRQWAQAEAHYQQALAIKIDFNDRYSQASTYHQLGRVAQEQRQWAQAEAHYQQALAITIDFNDRYSQARTYHQLGRVAEEQEQWQQAQEYYLKDLEITAESNDEHGLGITKGSLRRLYRAHPEAALVEAVAAVLGAAVDEVQAWLAAEEADGEA